MIYKEPIESYLRDCLKTCLDDLQHLPSKEEGKRTTLKIRRDFLVELLENLN
jgi:hypothetical protein